MPETPYVFERSGGLVHIRLRTAPAKCVADVRSDAFDLVWVAAYQEGYAAAIRDAVAKVGESGGSGTATRASSSRS